MVVMICISGGVVCVVGMIVFIISVSIVVVVMSLVSSMWWLLKWLVVMFYGSLDSVMLKLSVLSIRLSVLLLR